MITSRHVVHAVAALALGAAVLVGCGSDSATDADASSADAKRGDASAVCAELQVVKDLSDEMSLATDDMLGMVLSAAADGGGEFDDAEILAQLDEIAGVLGDSMPDVLAAYESAAELAEPEIAADIRVVADGTALLTPALVKVFADATSVEDLGAIDTALAEPELAEAATSAGLASLRLNDFTEPECGFRFSN